VTSKTYKIPDVLLKTRFEAEDLSLHVITGPHVGTTLRIQQELIRIGRADWCDLILHRDRAVSSVHCECWLDERGLRIRDLGSRNGISIEGCPIFDAYLVPGVPLKVGGSILLLKSHNQRKNFAVAYFDKSGTLFGKSRELRKIFSMLPKIAQRKVPTVLSGETGTGKSTIAKAIHLQSDSPKSPFIVVNCGALPEALIESELFGYEKGAFTGADRLHQGLLEQANGGTLFLDEIAELPLTLQPKLLDVLERKMVRRLGGKVEHPVEFRLITATNRDLSQEVDEGRFREDLYFRISVVHLEVPPLRNRKEDLPFLVKHILEKIEPSRNLAISQDAMVLLSRQAWPGNIRQLYNTLMGASTFIEGDVIEVEDLQLPKLFRRTSQETQQPLHQEERKSTFGQDELPNPMPRLPLGSHNPPVALKEVLEDAEQILIRRALEERGRNVADAAVLLDLSESWLYNRMRRYKIPAKRKSK